MVTYNLTGLSSESFSNAITRVYQAMLETARKRTELFRVTLILWEKRENM